MPIPPRDNCGCGGDVVAGGGTCASTIIREYCAADDGRPLLSKTITTCAGVSTTTILELDGTPFAGDVVRCDAICCDGGGSSRGELWMQIFHEQITVSNVVATLNPPPGADFALIENIPPSEGAIRWTDVTGSPVGGGVAGFGHTLMPGTVFDYRGKLADFQMIRDGANDATIEVTYYSLV